ARVGAKRGAARTSLNVPKLFVTAVIGRLQSTRYAKRRREALGIMKSPLEIPSRDSTGIIEALVPAAEYVRGSTDRQEYSTENQSLVHRAYAATYGMAIVRTYSDEARSGLVIDRRDALKQLIQD